MSDTSPTPKEPITIFLGAGASAAEGAPIQARLFSDYFKAPKRRTNILDASHHEVESYFQEVFSINPVNHVGDFPTFEEVLSVVDLALERAESFRGFSHVNLASNSGQLNRVRVGLIALLSKAIAESLTKTNGAHKDAVRNINMSPYYSVSWISTNYDLLIDNAIHAIHNFDETDYGFTHLESKDIQKKSWLYKLHGSLGWCYCPTCGTLKVTPNEKGIMPAIDFQFSTIDKSYCNKCETIYDPVIIAPTFYKDMSNSYLSSAWQQAQLKLNKSSLVVFCGYSFPDADMHIKYMIKKSQTVNENTRYIILNHHNGKKDDACIDEIRRYNRFLGARKVAYLKKGFIDFSAAPVQVIQEAKNFLASPSTYDDYINKWLGVTI